MGGFLAAADRRRGSADRGVLRQRRHHTARPRSSTGSPGSPPRSSRCSASTTRTPRAGDERVRAHPDDLAQLTCPLLVLHGTPDQVFLIENARALFDQAASPDKTFREWPDGDHCIYNHSHEKHTTVGDWFADRLLPVRPTDSARTGTMPTGRILITRRPHPHPGPAAARRRRGDVLVDDGKIAAIGPDLTPTRATVIDGTGRAVLPGFVDTHRHTWQGAIRQTGIGWDFGAYRQHIQITWGPSTPPKTSTSATSSAPSARSTPASPPCATSPTSRTAPTTPTRPSPHCRTPASAASSPTAGPPSTPTSGCCAARPPTPRTSAASAASFSPTTTPWSPCSAMLRGPELSTTEVTTKDIALARELGIRSSMHVGNGPWGPQFRGIGTLDDAGLLGEDMLFIHCCTSDDEELEHARRRRRPRLRRRRDRGRLPGLGAPATGRLLKFGIRPSLSIDTEAIRRRRHVQRHARRLSAHGLGVTLAPETTPTCPPSPRADLLEFATIAAPKPPGWPTGPAASPSGKDADLIVIDLAATCSPPTTSPPASSAPDTPATSRP